MQAFAGRSSRPRRPLARHCNASPPSEPLAHRRDAGGGVQRGDGRSGDGPAYPAGKPGQHPARKEGSPLGRWMLRRSLWRTECGPANNPAASCKELWQRRRRCRCRCRCRVPALPSSPPASVAAPAVQPRDAGSCLVRSPCSTSYLVAAPTRPVRRRAAQLPCAAANEVRPVPTLPPRCSCRCRAGASPLLSPEAVMAVLQRSRGPPARAAAGWQPSRTRAPLGYAAGLLQPLAPALSRGRPCLPQASPPKPNPKFRKKDLLRIKQQGPSLADLQARWLAVPPPPLRACAAAPPGAPARSGAAGTCTPPAQH